MKTNDFSYFIERYNAGEMEESEKLWFMKELEGNEMLRREVDLRKRTDLILKNKDLISLREKLNAIERNRAITTYRPGFGRAFLKYAAVLTVIVAISSLIFLNRGKLSNDLLFEKYYRTYEVPSALRSNVEVINSDYNLGLEYYKIHDYRNAAIYFAKVIESEPGNMHSVLLNGISQLENSEYPAAEKSFVKVIIDDNNLYIDHAKWYLALCYIKTDEQSKAREELIAIERSESIYKKDAKRILRRLK